MNNYLSHRWPTPVPPETNPAKKKKRRRIRRDLFIILLALAVLGGVTAGGYFGIRFAAEHIDFPADGTPSATTPPSDLPPDTPDGEEPSEEWLETWRPDLLPRSGPDPAVQLELLSRGGESALTPAQLYAAVCPSIVCVEASNQFGYGVGSGIILSSSGYIITNFHVIEGGTALTVLLLSDSSVHPAALVGYDKELDLAILKIEAEGLVPAVFGSSDELAEGDAVYAIGNPLGYLTGVISEGILSSRLDVRLAALDYPGRMLLTTASINSGNSGGALVDAYGRVVGITHAKLTGIRDNVVTEGLGLAIPISDAAPYLNRILRTGESGRPSLGIQCYSPVTVNGVTGIEVAETVPGTPAHGKLMPGDLIIQVNGVRVKLVDDVTRMLSEMDVDDTVTVTVIRGVRELELEVGLYDRLSELQ